MSLGIPLLYPKSNIADTSTIVIKCKDGYQVSYCDNNYYQQMVTFKTKKEVKKFIDSMKKTIDVKRVEEYLNKIEEDDEILDNWAAEQARKTKIEYWPGEPVKTKIKTFTCKGCGAPAKEDSRCDYCGNINYKE